MTEQTSYLSRDGGAGFEFEVDRWTGYKRLIDLRYWGSVRTPPSREHALELVLAMQERPPTLKDVEDSILLVQTTNRRNTYDKLQVSISSDNGIAKYKFPQTRHLIQKRRVEMGYKDEQIEPYPVDTDDEEETSQKYGSDDYTEKPYDSDSTAQMSVIEDEEGRQIRFEVDRWGSTELLVDLGNWGVIKAPKTRKQAIELALLTFPERPTEDEMDKTLKNLEHYGKNFVCMTLNYFADRFRLYSWFKAKYPETLYVIAADEADDEETLLPYPSQDCSLRRPESPGQIFEKDFAIDNWKWGTGKQVISDPFEIIEIAIATLGRTIELSSYHIYNELRSLDKALRGKRDITKYLQKNYFTLNTTHVWVQQSLRKRFEEERKSTNDWWRQAILRNIGLQARVSPSWHVSYTAPSKDGSRAASLSAENLSHLAQATDLPNPGDMTAGTPPSRDSLSPAGKPRKAKKTGKDTKTALKEKTENASDKGTTGRGLPMTMNYRTEEELIIARTEEFWEDGPYVQRGAEGIFLPPMRHPCILGADMSTDNLPPFFVKLTDEQTGHIVQFYSQQNRAKHYANFFWPADFDISGKPKDKRAHAGPPYTGPELKGTSSLKLGGPSVTAVCQGPGWSAYKGRHFYSSGRPMMRQPESAAVTPVTAKFTEVSDTVTSERTAKRRKFADSPITAALQRQGSIAPQIESGGRDAEMIRLKEELHQSRNEVQQGLIIQQRQTATIMRLATATETMAAARVWRQTIDAGFDQRVDKAIKSLELGAQSLQEVANGKMMSELADELADLVEEERSKE